MSGDYRFWRNGEMDIDTEKVEQLQVEIGEDASADEPMWRHTSFRVGGPATLFVRARTSAMVEKLVPLIGRSGIPWRVLGGATNVLVADPGIRECIISLDSDRADFEILEERAAPDGGQDVVVRLPAGCKLILAARRAIEQGLGGLEWAIGLPGTVGGAAVNNAGAHGRDIASIFEGATAVDASGAVTRLGPEDMAYGYRYSAFKAGLRGGTAIFLVDLRLRRAPREQLLEVASRFESTRKQRQPPGLSAGSVFKNPQGDYAGRLVEVAGMRGARIGGAQVSDLHGNFFLNTGGATSKDIFRLMRAVQDAVWDNSRVWLEPEVEMIGEWTEAERMAVKGPGSGRSEPSLGSQQPSAEARESEAPASWARNRENPDYEAEPGVKEEADS